MPKQLTAKDRAVLAQLLDLQQPKTEIARRLGVHRSTIYRELARNTGPSGYLDIEAQQRTDARRMFSRRRRKLGVRQARLFAPKHCTI
jgi:IS30 family transposase